MVINNKYNIIGATGLIFFLNNINADIYRIENTFDINLNQSSILLGVGPDKEEISSENKFFEYFKIRKDEKSSLLNYSLGPFKFKNTNTNIVLKIEDENNDFGAGISLDSIIDNFGFKLDLDLGANGETRIGTAINYDFGNLKIETAYDKVKLFEKDFEQILINGIYDLNTNNNLGLAYVKTNKDLESFSAYWIHHGKNIPWAWRQLISHDQIGITEQIKFETTIAQNPDPFFMNPLIGKWFVQRDSGDKYEVSPIPNLIEANSVNLNERTKKGIVAKLSASLGTQEDLELENGNYRSEFY
ncbi:hypothetical protein EOM09_06180, partial [bacterium]|nr:hypothetical protein [bacterium]